MSLFSNRNIPKYPCPSSVFQNIPLVCHQCSKIFLLSIISIPKYPSYPSLVLWSLFSIISIPKYPFYPSSVFQNNPLVHHQCSKISPSSIMTVPKYPARPLWLFQNIPLVHHEYSKIPLSTSWVFQYIPLVHHECSTISHVSMSVPKYLSYPSWMFQNIQLVHQECSKISLSTIWVFQNIPLVHLEYFSNQLSWSQQSCSLVTLHFSMSRHYFPLVQIEKWYNHKWGKWRRNKEILKLHSTAINNKGTGVWSSEIVESQQADEGTRTGMSNKASLSLPSYNTETTSPLTLIRHWP